MAGEPLGRSVFQGAAGPVGNGGLHTAIKKWLGQLPVSYLQSFVFCLPHARVGVVGTALTLFRRLLLSHGSELGSAIEALYQEVAVLEAQAELNHDELVVLGTLQKLRDDITVIEVAWRLGDPDPSSAVYSLPDQS